MGDEHIQQGGESHGVQGFDDNLVEEGVFWNRWHSEEFMGPGLPVLISFFRIGWFLYGIFILLHRIRIGHQMLWFSS